MSKYCPLVKHDVVYLVCQDCDNRVCDTRNCVNCQHHTSAAMYYGKPCYACKLTNAVIPNGNCGDCAYFQKDISKLNICYNCKHWIGGGDFDLSCKKDSYRIRSGIDDACKDFERKK